MRKLKRSECAIIHLVLTHKWYDMIASGYKVEEYRADTPHWSARLNTWMDSPKKYHVGKDCVGYKRHTKESRAELEKAIAEVKKRKEDKPCQ